MSDHVTALPMVQGLYSPKPHSDAGALLTETLDDSDRPVTIVATRPLTNIAVALVQRPDLITKVEISRRHGRGLASPRQCAATGNTRSARNG